MSEADEWDFWRRRLAGEEIAIHDGDPQTGFYRVRSKERTNWQPVAYWFEDGVLRCQVSGSDIDEQRARELWTRASEHPIEHDVYQLVIGGGNWPDLHDAAIEDRRNSRDGEDGESYEALKDRIDDLSREAEKLIKDGGAKTQNEADRASDLANRLGELWKKADEQRKAEKKPHDEAAKAVQERWSPVLAAADIYRRIKAAVVTPFLVAEENKRRAIEAETRRLAEEAARTGNTQLAEDAAVVAARVSAPVKAGSGGRRSVALRTIRDVVIEDRAAVLAYFAAGQGMTDYLQTCAEKAVRAGVTVPGTKVIERQVAA